MLYLIDEALNQVALFVQVLVIVALLGPIRARRNDCLCAGCFNHFDQRRRVIALIGNQRLYRVAFDQRLGQRAVVTLTSRQDESQRVAKRINRDVNLGRKAATTTP